MVAFENAKKPSVKTDEILKSTASSVTVSGEVLQENGAPVTEAGFCWSTESTFTVIEKNKKAYYRDSGGQTCYQRGHKVPFD